MPLELEAFQSTAPTFTSATQESIQLSGSPSQLQISQGEWDWLSLGHGVTLAPIS